MSAPHEPIMAHGVCLRHRSTPLTRVDCLLPDRDTPEESFMAARDCWPSADWEAMYLFTVRADGEREPVVGIAERITED